MMNVDELKPIPIMTLMTGYSNGESSGSATEFDEVFQQEINYFNFKPLYYGKTFMDIFDVRACYADSAMKRSVVLFRAL